MTTFSKLMKRHALKGKNISEPQFAHFKTLLKIFFAQSFLRIELVFNPTY